MKLGDLEVYTISLKLSEEIWKIYKLLDNDLKYTIGSQVIRSIDSIGTNIVEGYGKFHYKDSVKFYYNTRGSLWWERKHWILLFYKRNLIYEGKYMKLINVTVLGKKLNGFINRIKNKHQ